MHITINGLRPLSLLKREAARALGNKHALLARMIWSARNTDDPWVIIVTNRAGNPGTEITLETTSIERAHQRLLNGEEPPLLPREKRERSKRSEISESNPEKRKQPSRKPRRKR